MSAQAQALLYRFLLGWILCAIPVVIEALQHPDLFDWKWLAAGVLGGLLAALEKYVAPSIFNLPAATTVSPVASALGAPKVDSPASDPQPAKQQ